MVAKNWRYPALRMIITNQLCWFHLPKTAGTTTENLFKRSGIPILWNDDQSSPLKHLPLSEHPSKSELPLVSQHRVVNFRRLPFWLLSNIQHKKLMMNLSIDSSPMASGMFWREHDHEWLPADWWLERLRVDQEWSLLRVDHLKHDFLRTVQLYEPLSFRSRLRVRFAKSLNRNSYERKLSNWFSSSDLKCMYSANPLWAELEVRAYGNLFSFT